MWMMVDKVRPIISMNNKLPDWQSPKIFKPGRYYTPMEFYPWSDWALPEIYLLLIGLLVLVFLIWIISWIFVPFMKRRRRTRPEDQTRAFASFRSGSIKETNTDVVVDCSECGAVIEVHSDQRPVWVDCGICGTENMAR